MVPTFLID